MLASVLVDEVAGILNDAELGNEHIRWSVPELLNYLTEGIAAVVVARPSLFVISVDLSLSPGSVQRLPDEYSKLLDIHFNITASGDEGPNVFPSVHELEQAFPKPACPYPGVIISYAPYKGSDRFFDVTPAVPPNLTYVPKVKALVIMAPQTVTSVGQPINFPGSNSQFYQAALVDWMLYRSYSKDQESQTSFERSQAHFRAFQAYIGVAASVPKPSKSPSSTETPLERRATQ